MSVELYYGGSWNSAPAYTRDSISLSRGAPGEGQDAPPSTASVTLDNNTGDYNPRNPTSALYGLAGRNTPLRVSADSSVRSVTEAASWKPQRAIYGDAWTPLEGGGVLRRLQQGRTPLRSPAYRAFTSPDNDGERVAYWPFEEDSSATSASTPYSGTVTFGGPGTISFGALESITSARLAQFGSFDTFLTFVLPDWTNSLGQHFAGSLVRFPSGGLADNAIIWRFYFTGGNVEYVDLLYNTGDVLSLVAYSGGAVLGTLATADWTGYIDDRESFLFVTTNQNGANIDFRVRATGATYWLVESSGTLAGKTLGRMYQIVMGTGAGANGLGFGHLIVGNNKDSFGNFIDDLDADASYLVTGARGYDKETAGDRFLRLAAEEGVTATVVGDPADTQRMGPQPVDTLVNLLRECVKTDDALLFEPRDSLGLVMRTGRDRYNQASALDLSFTGSQIAPQLAPVLDDQQTRNDVTAKRRNGSQYTARKTSGPLNVNDPIDDPQGVGRIDTQVDVNTYTDDVLPSHANWHLHKGTVDEPRYQQVTVDLDAAPSLITAVNAVDIGDRITIANMPVTEAPDGEDLLVVGIRESLAAMRRLVTLITVPAAPYEIGIVGANDGSTDLRGQAVDTDDSTLASGITSTGTSLSVASAGGVLWTTDSNDWSTGRNGSCRFGAGLFIAVGGEVMRVTNITGASSPQTFTVVRSVNGVVKSHLAGAEVHVRFPAVVGL